MIFCHKCGTQQTDDSEFCRKCGAKLILDNNNDLADKIVSNETDNSVCDDTKTEYMSEHHSNNVEETDGNSAKTKIIGLIVIAAVIVMIAIIVVLVIVNSSKNDSGGSIEYVDGGSSDKITLDKTYASYENEISLNYPSEWFIDENFGDDDRRIFEIRDNAPENSDVYITFWRNSVGTSDSTYIELSDEQIRDIMDNDLKDWKNYDISNISQTDFGGIKAVKIEYSCTNPSDIEFKGIRYFYDTNYGRYGVEINCCEPYSIYENTINRIIDSVKINVIEKKEEIPTESTTVENKLPVAFGQDFLGMTIGEIKKKYSVSVMSLDCPYGPDRVYVTFKTKDGTEWEYYPIINMTSGVDFDSPSVPDDAQPIGVYLDKGAYLDENIYVGMTYDQIKKNMGSALGNQEWDDLTARYKATFAYTMSNGFISWIGNADGASASIEYYTRYIPEPETNSSSYSLPDWELEWLKKSAGVPDSLNVTYDVGTPYYWDGGDCQRCHVRFMYNGEEVASIDVRLGEEQDDIISVSPYNG